MSSVVTSTAYAHQSLTGFSGLPRKENYPLSGRTQAKGQLFGMDGYQAVDGGPVKYKSYIQNIQIPPIPKLTGHQYKQMLCRPHPIAVQFFMKKAREGELKNDPRIKGLALDGRHFNQFALTYIENLTANLLCNQVYGDIVGADFVETSASLRSEDMRKGDRLIQRENLNTGDSYYHNYDRIDRRHDFKGLQGRINKMKPEQTVRFYVIWERALKNHITNDNKRKPLFEGWGTSLKMSPLVLHFVYKAATEGLSEKQINRMQKNNSFS